VEVGQVFVLYQVFVVVFGLHRTHVREGKGAGGLGEPFAGFSRASTENYFN
jgi:hypothetical protein